MEQVSSASQDQSRGIEQINLSVSQMDRVTQSSAASAEETASASEELNGQTQEVRDAVVELAALIHGQSSNGGENGNLGRLQPVRPSNGKTFHLNGRTEFQNGRAKNLITSVGSDRSV